jgi:hypothetical protein
MANTFKNAKLKVQDTATDVYTVPSATTAIVIGCKWRTCRQRNEEVACGGLMRLTPTPSPGWLKM